uniref:thiamine diphosphokinase n=1 Tax=Fagus sylvatica TaxID=28930 RepID=A0A2N9ECD3_FAGSY
MTREEVKASRSRSLMAQTLDIGGSRRMMQCKVPMEVDVRGSSIEEINNLKKQLSKQFAMKDLGLAKQILGMRIIRDKANGTLKLLQTEYVKKILSRFSMDEAKPISTPLASHFRLTKDQSPKTEQEQAYMSKVPYASAIGSLMYAMVCTRPDIAYAVGVVSRYMSNPRKQHWEAVKWILRYKPDVIKGDMDSVRTEVLDFYAKLVTSFLSPFKSPSIVPVVAFHIILELVTSGTKILDESHDQDTTDLHKCIAYIRDSTPNVDQSKLCILVAGALGGRFDHEMGNINVLCRFSSLRIILLSDDCLIHLLPRTHCHEIHIQSSVEGPHCGLIPIMMPSKSTTTTGLQWDLTDLEMRFGGLVSTSNIVKGDKITVQSDSDLLWTISIKKS